MHSICESASELRDRIRALTAQFSGLPTEIMTPLVHGTTNLTTKLMMVGSTGDLASERAVMARCWQAEALSASIWMGLATPAGLLQTTSRQLGASIAALRAGLEGGDTGRVTKLAWRVRARRDELVSQQQLAFVVSHAADAASDAVSTLADAIPPGTGAAMPPPFASKLVCRAAMGLDRFANRIKAALPQLQYVATPLGKMLAVAEDVNRIGGSIASALSSPEALKSVIIDKVIALLDLIKKHPLELVHDGVDLLKKLGEKLVGKIEVVVDKIFAFLETLPEKLSGILDFLAGKLSKLTSALSIDDAIKKVSQALDSKTFCGLMAQVKRFAALAVSIVEGFIPKGELQDKLVEILQSVQMIASPSELIAKYAQPMLNMLWSVNGTSKLAAPALQHFGTLNGTVNAPPPPPSPDGLVERTVKMKLYELKAVGMAEIDRLVGVALNMTDGLIGDLAEKAGNLGADLFERLMPAWIPEVMGKLAGWIKNTYQTLRFAHQLVNNTQPIVHLLNKPKALVKLACPTPGCDGSGAPNQPDLSHIEGATEALFGTGLPNLELATGALDALDATRRCTADPGCASKVATALTVAESQLATYVEGQHAVMQLAPYVGWYGVCASESAQRAKSLGYPLEMLAQFWRSITHPGGLLQKLQTGLCREQGVRARYSRFNGGVVQPAYDVPDWLTPHFCAAATALAEAGDRANAWINEKADDLWEKILEATNWAADLLQRVQEWAASVMGDINEKLDGVKAAASDVLHKYIMPVRSGLDKVLGFIDKADGLVVRAQRITEGAKSAVSFIGMVQSASDGFEGALPANLKLGGLQKLANALQVVAGESAGNTSDCNQPLPLKDLLRTLGSHWQAIKGFFAEATDGMSAGEWKALPAKLLSAFGGGVCFVRQVATTIVSIVDSGVDKLQGFMDMLAIGVWKDPPVVDCQGSYTCLVPVQRSTGLYRKFFFPVGHIQYWDLTAPALFDPCKMTTSLQSDGEMAFRFTVPGLISKYALQSSTFFKLQHTTCGGFVPRQYVLAYRPMEERAPPNCTAPDNQFLGCTDDGGVRYTNHTYTCPGRASLLSVVDGFGRNMYTKQLMLADGVAKWSGEVTGVAVRSLAGQTMGSASDNNHKGTVYVCGRPCTPPKKGGGGGADNGEQDGDPGCPADTDWEVVRFDLEAVRAPGDGAVRALGRQKVPWLRQMGASRCTLSYVPQSGWNTPGYLWVGASVPGIKTGHGTPGTADGSSGGTSSAAGGGGGFGRRMGMGDGESGGADDDDDASLVQDMDDMETMGRRLFGTTMGGATGTKLSGMGGGAPISSAGEARNYRVQVAPMPDGQLAGLEGSTLLGRATGLINGRRLQVTESDGEAPQSVLKFGADVQGFAFFDNKFGQPHVAVARCSLHLPTQCSIEFHFLRGTCAKQTGKLCSQVQPTYPQTLSGTKEDECDWQTATTSSSGCTLQMAMKIPGGIGSLQHDSSLNAIPHQYFHASYIGTTREYYDTTQRMGREPEDRIFLIRAPILQNMPTTVTKNWIECKVLGDDLFEPRPLLPFKDEQGEDTGAVQGGTSSDEQMGSMGRRMTANDEASVDAYASRRDAALTRQLRAALGRQARYHSGGGDDKLVDLAHDVHARRQLKVKIGSGSGKGCIAATTDLMKPYLWKVRSHESFAPPPTRPRPPTPTLFCPLVATPLPVASHQPPSLSTLAPNDAALPAVHGYHGTQ